MRFPKPHTELKSGSATFRFYLGDCVNVLPTLPRGCVGAIVTSPPYNLGIQYRSYDDTMPRQDYLAWTTRWVHEAAGALAAHGSLFLNVGAKPTDPWIAMDVAQAVRSELRLQNTIHWVKSIAIEKALAGTRAGLQDDLAVGHYKPINSQRFLHDCHEFVFHFTPDAHTPLDRQAVGVKYQDQSNIGRWRTAAAGVRCRGNTWFIPYETIQNRDKDRPHPGDLPAQAPGNVPAAARPRSTAARGRSVHGTRFDRRRVRAVEGELRRDRDGSWIPGGSGGEDARRSRIGSARAGGRR